MLKYVVLLQISDGSEAGSPSSNTIRFMFPNILGFQFSYSQLPIDDFAVSALLVARLTSIIRSRT